MTLNKIKSEMVFFSQQKIKQKFYKIRGFFVIFIS